MSRIRSKDTSPEVALRKVLWREGCRSYRLHSPLPGKPDLFFPKYGIVVFIDGCFWHKCPKCFIRPETNASFWTKKINENVKRDKRVNGILKKEGYCILRFWEHEIHGAGALRIGLKILRALKIRGYSRGNQDS